MKMQFSRFTFFILFIFFFGCSSYRKTTISKETKSYVKLCSDSLNNVINTNVIPQFLYDPCFDYQKRYWLNLHTPLSLRKMIVEKVNNKKSLDYILKLQFNELNQLCSRREERDTIGLIYYKVPYIDKTFEQLLRERYNKIK